MVAKKDDNNDTQIALRKQRFRVDLNGVKYDFSLLSPEYSDRFLETLTQAWCSSYALDPISSARQRFFTLRRFLRWIAKYAEANTLAGEFLESVNSSITLSRERMQDVVESFASRVRDINCLEIVQSPNPKTRSSALGALSTTLKTLAESGLWPDIGPIRNLDGRLLTQHTTKSLGEADSDSDAASGKSQSIHEKMAEVDELNIERLKALRSVMVEELKAEYYQFLEGGRLLEVSVPYTSQEIRSIFDQESGQYRNIAFDWVKADDEPTKEIALSCLLKWIKENYSGLVRSTAFQHVVQKLIWKLGGQKHVTKYLEGTLDALLPAHTIVLIDTAFNVQTCDDLAVNPFVGGVQSGVRKIETISARKRRAAGKIVEATVEGGVAELRVSHKTSSLSTIEVLKIWQEMSAPIRERVHDKKTKELLWIIPSGRNNLGFVSLYHTSRFDYWWRSFLSRISSHPILGGIEFQRRMIRPTILQISASKNKLSHIIPQVLANHGSAGTTYRYLSSDWFKKRLADQIREFQNLFEASFSSDMKEFALKLGIPAEELSRRRSLAEETGFGFVCASKRPARNLSRDCMDIERCASCDFRRFVPTRTALESLWLTNRSLKEQEEGFRAQNPDRWLEIWLPYLALTDALIGRLKQSRYNKAFKDAVEAVEQKLEASELQVISLW